ncbi:brain protein I3 isoform X1 [Diorhabda carinulata]|uniref:brain protein I3 isoform X1 n=1 Tax=Diorhabda carinulata TaxID=1163345 RepID=UPI0025A19377|nr:brain protein I3 isoform X1 [Diorhabda carinulata]
MDPEKRRPPPYDDGRNQQANLHLNQPTFAPMSEPASSIQTTVVVNPGVLEGCPVCHNKSWTGTYSCCAWLWCLCCFPCGIICCCCMRKKKCTNCGYRVG